MARSRPLPAASSPRENVVLWRLAVLIAALSIVAIYLPAIKAPYIFDDQLSILQNESITRLWPLHGTAEHPGPLYPLVESPLSARPLVNLSLAVNYRLHGLAPGGYRVVNLLLHLAVALMLGAIVRRTLLLPRFCERFQKSASWLALGAAWLWAVHPLTTEVVVYITQRTELMVAACYLLTLYASIRYWDADSRGVKRRWLAAAVTAAFAGAASKEIMVSAPLVVFLYDWAFLGGRARDVLRRSWPLYTGLAASWLLVAWLQVGAPRGESAGFGVGISLGDWWATQAEVFCHYLRLALWPAPLVIHYQFPVVSPATNWGYLLFVAAWLLTTAALLGRRHPAGFVMASVCLILAPTHLIPIPTEMAAERRMYLPLGALMALAVAGSAWLVGRRIASDHAVRSSAKSLSLPAGATWGGLALVTMMAIVYGVASARRVALYREPLRLWQDAVLHQPADGVAHQNLATALVGAGHLPEAAAEYRLAIQSSSDNAQAHYALGMLLANSGQWEAAAEHLRAAARLKPNAYRIRNNLAVVLFSAGRLPEAIAEFENVLEIEPNFSEARDNLQRARQRSTLPKTAP